MHLVREKSSAAELLREIKEKIAKDKLVFLNGRPNNAQTIADLGIAPREQTEIIKSLSVTDYCGEPEPDHKYPWKMVALFGKAYKGKELYIKLSIGVEGAPVTCLSFHEANAKMEYPFR